MGAGKAVPGWQGGGRKRAWGGFPHQAERGFDTEKTIRTAGFLALEEV